MRIAWLQCIPIIYCIRWIRWYSDTLPFHHDFRWVKGKRVLINCSAERETLASEEKREGWPIRDRGSLSFYHSNPKVESLSDWEREREKSRSFHFSFSLCVYILMYVCIHTYLVTPSIHLSDWVDDATHYTLTERESENKRIGEGARSVEDEKRRYFSILFLSHFFLVVLLLLLLNNKSSLSQTHHAHHDHHHSHRRCRRRLLFEML